MIVFVVTTSHNYALRELETLAGAPKVRILSWNRLFRMKALPAATYVFGDFDRLNFWQLELAGKVCRAVREAGLPALNDPARVLQRHALIRALYKAGLNSFTAWDAAIDGLPDRYPVFLRTKAAHRGTLSDLLGSAAEAESALEKALGDGVNLHDLMFVEYCAEPVREGLFRKLSAFRVGDRIITGMSVHETGWHAKFGASGLADAALYDEEFAAVETNAFAGALAPHFAVSKAGFGRADFTMVGGRVQVYEINTNPAISQIREHPSATRLAADRLFHERLAEALRAIDTPDGSGRTVPMDFEAIVRQRRHDRRVLSERWVP